MVAFVVNGRDGWKTKPRRSQPREAAQWVMWWGWRKVFLKSASGMGMSAFAVTDGKLFSLWYDHRGYLSEVDEMKKKKPGKQDEGVQHLASVESVLLGKLQPLINHAAVTRYDDGDLRQPGWWTVKTMGSAWVIEIKDPDTAMRLVVIQATLDDALTLAGLLLDAEEAPWEPDPWLLKAKNQKKK